MDKYEYKVRSEEIKALIAQKEYAQAVEIADTIDWRRVKSVMMLCTISDLYKINRRYVDSYDLLMMAYERHPGGRTIVYALCELSIRMGNVTQAWEFYKEYLQIAPKDPGRYILQYKIYEAEEVNLEERIAVLEELKNREFRERWVYELAYLYHRIGLASKCVDECDELIAFLGDGKYVIKAMELKMLHQPLSPEQQFKYDNRFAPVEEIVEEVDSVQEASGPTQEVEKEETVSQVTTTWSGTHVAGAEGILEVEFAETKRIPVEEVDIQVKTVGLNPGDTINLQQEIAAGVQQFLEEKSRNEEITQAILAPMLETDTVDSESVESALAKEAEPPVEVVEGSVAEEAQPESMEEKVAEELQLKTIEDTVEEELLQEGAEPTGEAVQDGVEAEAGQLQEEAVQETVEQSVDTTAATVMERLRRENTEDPVKDMDSMLSMGPDGQLSFVMPEKAMIEKQITGQICFSEFLVEWEQKKKEIEVKSQQEIRKIIQRNTHQMFDEFEAAKRDDLLEQLEQGRDLESVIAEAEGRILDEDGLAVPPSLLEVDTGDGLVEAYEAVTVEEAEEAVELNEEASEEAEQESDTEPNEVQELQGEDVSEVQFAEELAAETEEYREQVQDLEDSTEETVEIEYLTEQEAETDIEPEEKLVQELVEEILEEESDEDREESQLAEETAVEEESVVEAIQSENEPVEEVFSEIDAAYEAALMGATAEEEEEGETGIDYETISMPTNDIEAVIQQEAEKLRSLTREERELFGPFIQGRSSKAQLIHAIDNISMAAYTGNVIITGAEGIDTLGLAKNIIRDIQLTDSNFSGKIAKISGDSLNKREVSAVLEGLDNGALIIQKANGMNAETAESLYKALQQEKWGIVVIMEGTKKAMAAFLEQNQKLQSCFTGRIDMEALSDVALTNFGKKYAREKEYSLDELAGLALSHRIAERQASDHVVTILEVKEIVDAAIESANRRTLGHFFDVLLGKRYDDEDMIIIREKDFK